MRTPGRGLLRALDRWALSEPGRALITRAVLRFVVGGGAGAAVGSGLAAVLAARSQSDDMSGAFWAVALPPVGAVSVPLVVELARWLRSARDVRTRDVSV